MAKTAWNATITADNNDAQDVPAKVSLLKRARVYLDLSSKIIKLLGPEGDPSGPLEELAVLENLLHGMDSKSLSGYPFQIR
jgi:SET and MYND domain-containing protein